MQFAIEVKYLSIVNNTEKTFKTFQSEKNEDLSKKTKICKKIMKKTKTVGTDREAHISFGIVAGIN